MIATTKSDEASPTESIWKAEARSMIPALAERASEAEAMRRIPQPTLDAFSEAGFFRLLVPRVHGGSEASLIDLADLTIEVGRGCTSSAWIVSFYALHGWLASLFPEEGQNDFFAQGADVLLPAALSPNGVATPVDGGYRLSGRWQWGTGVHHAGWAMVSAIVGEPEEGKPPVMRALMLPIDDVEIIDTWHIDGMCATGSDDLQITDAFVPASRTLDSTLLRTGETPGAQVHKGALYRTPTTPALCLLASCPAIGTAIAAVDAFQQRIKERTMNFGRGSQRDKPAAQMRLANCMVRLEAVRLLHRSALERLIEAVDAGNATELDLRAHIRMAAAHTVAECKAIVREVLDASGATAHFHDSPLQRMARDLAVASGHVVFDMDTTAELCGRVAVGLEPQVPLL